MDTARRRFPSPKKRPGRTKSSCRRGTPTAAACFPSGTIGTDGRNSVMIRARMASGENGEIWEIPLSVGSIGPFRIPFGGGGYLRAYPLMLTDALFRRLKRDGRHGVVYIHPWELDTRQPAIQAPFFRRLRHHIGIPKMKQKLIHLLRSMQFGTVAQLLEANPEPPNRRHVPPAAIPPVHRRTGDR